MPSEENGMLSTGRVVEAKVEADGDITSRLKMPPKQRRNG